MHLFSNIIGVFVFDEKFNVVDEILFNSVDDYKNKEKSIEKIRSRHKNLKEADADVLGQILPYFKNKKYSEKFYEHNLVITKENLRNSVTSDVLIIQGIKSVAELEKAINLLVKRLRDWYELYNPEASKAFENHEIFVEKILENEKSELLKELKVHAPDSIGADFEQEDLEPIKSLTHQIHDLYQLKKSQLDYLSIVMDGLCPNIKAICGPFVAAKLIEHAGSLKRLSEMPASTIQILGAEAALFRHMKTGARPPRHGVIVNHPLLAKAPDKMHGKIARTLADKISIAAKVDYFHGQFIGDKLLNDIQKKFHFPEK